MSVAAAAALVGSAVTATGIATASTKPAVYSACVKTVGGTLYKVKVNGTPTCSGTDKLISWNQQGSRGPRGTPGKTGKTGPRGLAGTTVNSCSSPPGRYLDFDTCSLASSDWPFVDLTGTLFVDANLHLALLVSANLRHANLTHANLTYAAMSSADLTYANLSYADLADADLSYATLANANLAHVTWYDTTCPDRTVSSASSPQTCIGHLG